MAQRVLSKFRGPVGALLIEADRMGAEVAENAEGATVRAPGSPGRADSPLQYESRKLYEKQLIDDLIGAEDMHVDTRPAVQAITGYLAAERRRTKTALEDLRETAEHFSSLEGPRHLLDATTATYRIGVRLQGVDTKKTYSVKVSTRKAGVHMLARSAFKPAGPAPPVSRRSRCPSSSSGRASRRFPRTTPRSHSGGST